MEQEFLDKLEAMDLKDHAPTVEKGLLDLPVNLMHEVFGPLDARSLLETAKSHEILCEQALKWPGKKWEIVYIMSTGAIIDYETFDRREATLLLYGAEHGSDIMGYRREHKEPGTTKTSIFDLPYDLLCPIMEPLETGELMSVAKCHPNLLQAAKNIKGKRFGTVRWLNEKVIFTGPYHIIEFTPGEAELLLTGASVDRLEYNVQADISPDMHVQTLTIQGEQQHAHKCAGLIEKWKSSHVVFPKWNVEAFSSNPDLARVLKDVERLELGYLPVEWLDDIPEWKFTFLKFRLCTGGQDFTSQIQALGQKLYEQWSRYKRDYIYISIELDSELRLLQIGAGTLPWDRADALTLNWWVAPAAPIGHCFSMSTHHPMDDYPSDDTADYSGYSSEDDWDVGYDDWNDDWWSD